MKRFLPIIFIAFIVIILIGCVPSTVLSPNSLSADELMEQAVALFAASDYEEAIIAYLGVIEIEPNNANAQLGLAKSYRQSGDIESAISTLNSSFLASGNPEADLELGYAYLDNADYQKAQSLAQSWWKDDSRNNDFGIIMLLSLAAQNNSDALYTMMSDTDFSSSLEQISNSSTIYFGKYDANGSYTGKSVAIYHGGYIYAGEYVDGVRCGKGSLVIQYSGRICYFSGMWEDDLPNGIGVIQWRDPLNSHSDAENVDSTLSSSISGMLVDGLFDGQINETWSMESGEVHHWSYNVEHGNVSVTKKIRCIDCNAILLRSNTALGIMPQGEV